VSYRDDRELTETWLALGADELPAQSTPAVQSATDIRLDLDDRIAHVEEPGRRRLHALDAESSCASGAASPLPEVR
jgi:hypothetical protein